LICNAADALFINLSISTLQANLDSLISGFNLLGLNVNAAKTEFLSQNFQGKAISCLSVIEAGEFIGVFFTEIPLVYGPVEGNSGGCGKTRDGLSELEERPMSLSKIPSCMDREDEHTHDYLINNLPRTNTFILE